MPVITMYVVTHARATAMPVGSASFPLPRVKNHTAATASTTAAETLERIVKKLKKFAMSVGTWRPASIPLEIVRTNCAMTAAAMSTAIATRATDQISTHLGEAVQARGDVIRTPYRRPCGPHR